MMTVSSVRNNSSKMIEKPTTKVANESSYHDTSNPSPTHTTKSKNLFKVAHKSALKDQEHIRAGSFQDHTFQKDSLIRGTFFDKLAGANENRFMTNDTIDKMNSKYKKTPILIDIKKQLNTIEY